MSLLNVSVSPLSDDTCQISSASVVSIRSNSLVIYDQPFHSHSPKAMNAKQLANLKLKGKVPWIKSASVKRIEKFLGNWIKSIMYENAMRHRCLIKTERYSNFITLTLSAQQIHSDQLIKKKVLDYFLQKLKSKYNMKHYFWRAELQKNYNIHFHVVSDVFINKYDLQREWNEAQQRLNYIDRFENKYKHRNPPSTHVQSIKDLETMTSYVCKYVVKDSGEIAPDGRKWDASRGLKEYESIAYPIDSDLADYLKQLVEDEKVVAYEGERCAVLRFTKKFDWRYDYRRLQQLEYNDLQRMYTDLYSDKLNDQITGFVDKVKNKQKPMQLELFPPDYTSIH